MTFAVSTTGRDVQVASGPEQLLNMKYPFTKLDTTKTVSFQTLSILFNNDPPQPSALSYTSTLIYSFPHPYTYVPSVWMQWQNPSPQFPSNPSSGNSATTFYPFGDDSSGFELVSDISGLSPGFNGQPFVALVKYNNAGPVIQTTTASLVVKADTANVNIYLIKECMATISGSVIPVHVTGITLNARVYVFTEPAST